MRLAIGVIKWFVIAAVTLVLLLAAYSAYVIWSFDTQTLPEHYGAVQTELFLAEGDRQPLLVGLGGADGGNSWAGPHGEKQRALLRDNGYAFLSIAYFGAEGTPTHLDRIAIEGVHKAVMQAAQDPRINSSCIAVMGVSRGGELALLLGSLYPEYRSVVGMVPGSAVFAALTQAMTTPGFAHEGQPLAFVPVPWSATFDLLSGNLRGAFEKMMRDADAMAQAAIKVEDIAGPVLLVSGTHDEQWPSMEMSDAMMARLEANGFPHHSQHLPLEGGHNEHHDEFEQVVGFLDAHLLPQAGCRI
jgi:pimeloyl-ACP methyl ester carboxylesterase